MLTISRTLTEWLKPDDPRWTEVLASVPHDFFHLPGYVDAYAAMLDGEPLLLLLDAGRSGLAVPLVKRSLAPFGPAFADYHDVVSPYGYPGPLVWGADRPEQIATLHQELAVQLKRANVVSMFLRLHPFLGPPEATLAALAGEGGVRWHGPVVYLDLRDPEASWHGINPANRRVIRRLIESGHQVVFDRWETLDQVLAAYAETMERHSAPGSYRFPRAFFTRLRHATGQALHLATSSTPGGEVTGGVFFTEVGGLIHYFLTGTFFAHRALSPNKLLIDALRRWGLRRDCHTLNLGGGLGAREDSLHTFKTRFSRTTVPFYTLRRILLPEVYRSLCRDGEGDDGFFPGYRQAEAHAGAGAGAGD